MNEYQDRATKDLSIVLVHPSFPPKKYRYSLSEGFKQDHEHDFNYKFDDTSLRNGFGWTSAEGFPKISAPSKGPYFMNSSAFHLGGKIGSKV